MRMQENTDRANESSGSIISDTLVGPEKTLACAVFIQALLDMDSSEKIVKADAELWLSSSDLRWMYGFIPLCHTFNLDPDAVREQILKNGCRRELLQELLSDEDQDEFSRAAIAMDFEAADDAFESGLSEESEEEVMFG